MLNYMHTHMHIYIYTHIHTYKRMCTYYTYISVERGSDEQTRQICVLIQWQPVVKKIPAEDSRDWWEGKGGHEYCVGLIFCTQTSTYMCPQSHTRIANAHRNLYANIAHILLL